jgi:hypothetical protein
MPLLGQQVPQIGRAQNATKSTGVAAGQEDARLNRMQFDLIYSF